ncbi:MAG: hypothetical protein LBM75_09360 [Myxococcales bacterium]|jgi:hypothetical protein|nr:hypothetical protein [Myxococcales bacterium]
MTDRIGRLKKPAAERSPRDLYETPFWVTDLFLRHPNVRLALSGRQPSGHDPCCGNAAIQGAVTNFEHEIGRELICKWFLSDIAPGEHASAYDVAPPLAVNFLAADRFTSYLPGSICLTNPPYSRALEFVEKSVETFELTAMLLGISFLESLKRHEWLKAHPPTLYVISERADFTGEHQAKFGLAWFAWAHARATEWARIVADGRVHMLGLREETGYRS